MKKFKFHFWKCPHPLTRGSTSGNHQPRVLLGDNNENQEKCPYIELSMITRVRLRRVDSKTSHCDISFRRKLQRKFELITLWSERPKWQCFPFLLPTLLHSSPLCLLVCFVCHVFLLGERYCFLQHINTLWWLGWWWLCVLSIQVLFQGHFPAHWNGACWSAENLLEWYVKFDIAHLVHRSWCSVFTFTHSQGFCCNYPEPLFW